MSDVCLISMPMVALERPSLALGLLQSSAARVGVGARSVYPSFDFAEAIGVELYNRLLHTAPDQNIADWLFAGSAFPGEDVRHERFLQQLDRRKVAGWLWLEPDELGPALRRIRREADTLVTELAREIVASGARVVGCTSVFQQQVASLALLRKVRELDPSITTVIGGANCEAEMGAAVHQSFDWIDFVVSGEADLLFGDLCRAILESVDGGRSLRDLPAGTLGPAHRGNGASVPIGRARVENLDQIPIPDFSDYFEALSRSALRDEIYPGLLVETSRGCWWGEKHHCTFCGLNGDEMAYRSKSDARVLEEFEALVERHGTHRLLVVDNILNRRHLETVIPALAEAGAPYSLFYETKANLKRDQIELLSDAGVRRVQPGFESMHRGALELFDKGTTPVINLQYLKVARELGTFVTWNFLWQIPGEEWSWYGEVADWIPLVTHLQPPNTLCAVRFDRFSVYHDDPARFGLMLRPGDGFRSIYPLDDATLDDLAYYFIDDSRPAELALRALDPGIRRMEKELDGWMTAWDRVRRADGDASEIPGLELRWRDDGAEIIDTRPVAPGPTCILDGPQAEVLRICDAAPSRQTLVRRLRKEVPGLAASAIDDIVLELMERKLVLELDDRLIGLPVPAQRRSYIPVEEYPGGYFRPESRSHHPRLRRAMNE